jgi:hypothetical protein
MKIVVDYAAAVEGMPRIHENTAAADDNHNQD